MRAVACVVACTVVCAAGVLPGQAWATGASASYGFAEGAETVDGATSSAEGHRLNAGKVYKSSLPRVGRRFYRLELRAEESAYVAVTAVPASGSTVSYADGVEVSVQDADGNNCSPGESQEARFGASESARPITATAARRVGPDEKSCEGPGTYYVLVERTSAPESSRTSWDLELRVASEPALREKGATTPPGPWDSATPVAPTGERKVREGGTSFNGARALGKGVWGDSIEPGGTLFYRVPVDWGQRLSVAAELGSLSSGGEAAGGGERGGVGREAGRGTGYVASALVMTLSNPVRAEVDDADTAYDGSQKSAVLDPVPPVAYENRFAPADAVAAMRFAGWYYLTVHLSADVAGKFGAAPLDLTLRVDVDGAARPGPVYAGSPVPDEEFGVTERDTEAARRGETAAGSGTGGGDAGAMAVLATGGIGTGVVLLGVLGGWTLVARRRAAGEGGPGDASAGAQFGPPRGW
ncbi:hypothetical protein CP975_17760 [Streptomyces alboniger]|uniref:Uncharacterized protein n=1 Tax=Streptomyces alboniger TaxID=132473 RepID=A0A5J6HPZ4_STRAD|nr:hypothetical protein CP975_17760 [Streptomyces alboniger]